MPWMKCYVLLAWALDTILSVFLLKGLYIYLVKDIGNIQALGFYIR